MSQSIAMPAYSATDLPACLASLGLVRVLTRYSGMPVTLSWGRLSPTLHLPQGETESSLHERLSGLAAERAESDHWSLLDTCDDPVAWEAAAKRVAETDPVDGGAHLMGVGCYYAGEGGRSPLIATSRNMSPGRWGRKAALASAGIDWAEHFRSWRQGGGSWQGWRWHTERTPAEFATVWLALEGLACVPCSMPSRWERAAPRSLKEESADLSDVIGAPTVAADQATRRDVTCAGWQVDRGVPLWHCPLPDTPVGLDVLRSMIVSGYRRHAEFRRQNVKQGNYWLREYGPGTVIE